MKRLVIIGALLGVLIVPVIIYGQVPARPVAPPVSVLPPQLTGSGGRFMMMTPPVATADAYNNFLWVLDTQTGQISAYRFVSITDPNTKATLGFGYSKMVDADALRGDVR